MAIQVTSTVHAAATLFVVEKDSGPLSGQKQYLQSPQGCIMQRLSQDGHSAWLILLDYPLDVGSTALSVQLFASHEQDTTTDGAGIATPLLVHIDDRVKLLVLIGERHGELKALDIPFHALFFNYQANQQELYPVELVNTPPLPPPQPPIP
jgi:hypothetical protein